MFKFSELIKKSSKRKFRGSERDNREGVWIKYIDVRRRIDFRRFLAVVLSEWTSQNTSDISFPEPSRVWLTQDTRIIPLQWTLWWSFFLEVYSIRRQQDQQEGIRVYWHRKWLLGSHGSRGFTVPHWGSTRTGVPYICMYSRPILSSFSCSICNVIPMINYKTAAKQDKLY